MNHLNKFKDFVLESKEAGFDFMSLFKEPTDAEKALYAKEDKEEKAAKIKKDKAAVAMRVLGSKNWDSSVKAIIKSIKRDIVKLSKGGEGEDKLDNSISDNLKDLKKMGFGAEKYAKSLDKMWAKASKECTRICNAKKK